MAAMAYGTPGHMVARLPDRRRHHAARIFRSRANQLADEPESELRMASSGRRGDELPEHPLRVDGVGRLHGARLHQLPPVLDPPARCFSRQERVVLLLDQRDQRPEGVACVTDEVDLHRVAQAESCVPSMSICTPRGLPLLGQELGVREAASRPSGRCRTGSSSSQLGFVPSRPMAPVTYGRSSGSTALPSSALATPAPQLVGDSRGPRRRACSAPAPTSMATFSPALRTSAARRSSSSGGTTRGRV